MINRNCFKLGHHMLVASAGIVILHLALDVCLIACAGEEEPPFPLALDMNQRQIKILSESVEDNGIYHTVEEYLDLNKVKSAMLIMDKNGHEVLFQDGKRGLSYTYKPYTCKTESISDLLDDKSSIGPRDWYHKFSVQVNSDDLNSLDDYELVRLNVDLKGGPINANDESTIKEVELRLFNVLGLWIFAGSRDKTYSKSKIVYSASKDMYRNSFCWTVRAKDSSNDMPMEVKFYFVDHEENIEKSDSIPPKLSLELIEIKPSGEDGKVSRTINVLSVDYSIDSDVEERLLEVPVGYGCYKRLGTTEHSTLDIPGGPDEEWEGIIYKKPALFDLEITATDFQHSTNKASRSWSVQSADTIGVQVAHSYIQAKDIKYMRIKSTEADVKVLMNYLTNVKYTIDMRRGTCEMSHIPKFLEFYPGAEQGLSPIQFSNGLQLDLMSQHAKIFHHSDQLDKFSFVKRTPPNYKQPEMFYYETDSLVDKSSQRQRIVRTFVKKDSSSPLELYSVLLWTLDDQMSKLLQSFQINVIDLRYINNYPDEPKLFDISEECYLNDERKHSGQDYAWVELNYPAISRDLDIIASNELEFKRTFYWNFFGGSNKHLDFSRIPRLELQFEDEALVLRMLILDIPHLELVYDKSIGKMMSLARVQSREKQLSPDLRHCAELCRINHCTIFTYCNSLSCLISHDQLTTSSLEEFDRFLSPEPSCDTFSLPDFQRKYDQFDQSFFHEYSLHGILARLQHQDYGLVSLPRVPDEVALPPSESGLSSEDYTKAVESYYSRLDKFLSEQTGKLSELTMVIKLNNHFISLMPTKFEIDNDPLSDFNLYNDDSADSTTDDYYGNNMSTMEKMPSFHEGLPGYRYKSSSLINAYRDANDHADANEDDGENGGGANDGDAYERANLREFSGLTYDQCELACLDSRCGSFSYCKTRQECTLSNLNNTGLAQSLQLVERDADCLVAQRDFLSNYVKFENSFMPTEFVSQMDSRDAAACALECEAISGFRCLAFDFCEPSRTRVGSCYYHSSRSSGIQHLQHHQKQDKTDGNPRDDSVSAQPKETGCSHYIRSSLADFNRIEYRRVVSDQLDKLKTTTIEGKTVSSCAEMCATELLDCTAFQFCFNLANTGPATTEGPATAAPRQHCIMIQSRPNDEDAAEMEATIVEDSNRADQVMKAGKFLEFEPSCQLFALRKDSSEAHLRDLAIATKTRRATGGGQLVGSNDELDGGAGQSSGRHMNLFLLYTIVTLVSALLGCGLCYAKEHNDFVRFKMDQMRNYLHI